MSAESEYIKRIAKVLKAKFSNLTVEETIDLAAKILDELPIEGLPRG